MQAGGGKNAVKWAHLINERLNEFVNERIASLHGFKKTEYAISYRASEVPEGG